MKSHSTLKEGIAQYKNYMNGTNAKLYPGEENDLRKLVEHPGVATEWPQVLKAARASRGRKTAVDILLCLRDSKHSAERHSELLEEHKKREEKNNARLEAADLLLQRFQPLLESEDKFLSNVPGELSYQCVERYLLLNRLVSYLHLARILIAQDIEMEKGQPFSSFNLPIDRVRNYPSGTTVLFARIFALSLFNVFGSPFLPFVIAVTDALCGDDVVIHRNALQAWFKEQMARRSELITTEDFVRRYFAGYYED